MKIVYVYKNMDRQDNSTEATQTQVSQKNEGTFDLTSQILQKIESESVTPRAKWVYSTQEYLLWLLWFVTVLLGAISVAVTSFVFSHQRFALYELTHDNFVTFAVDVLPLLWLLLFGVMVVFAVFNMRHTRRGYRYPLWQILGSSVVLSLALGALLHLAGAGFSLDKKMGALARGYASQEKLELKWWQDPRSGRLVGSAMYVREGGATDIRFIDFEGVAWQLELDELHEEEVRLLTEGKQVRIFGVSDGGVFHACGAMPWVQDRSYKGEELAEIQRGARAKIDGFKDEKMAMMATSTVCGELMRRLPKPPKMAL